jgi:integrase
MLKVAAWLQTGIPTGRKRKPRPLEIVTSLDGIIKSIKKTELNADDALRIVAVLKERSLIDFAVVKAGNGNVLFTDFLKTFWTFDASPYVREKLARRYSIGRRYCYDMLNRIQNYWIPAFKDKTLNSVTKAELKAFSLTLAEKGLAPGSINKTMIAGKTALGWAYQEGMISTNPADGLLRFSGECKKRGVLTPQEAATVFGVEWNDNRAYTANLLSITTGLRSGEVLALRKSDIGIDENILYIRHSWASTDGLKSPKNGEARKVPLLPEVREKLMELLRENPHGGDDPFIFYGMTKHKPVCGRILLESFKEACRAVGIDPVSRGIVFHSHRHYYAARMADRMTVEQVSRITGHKSRAVFEEYADHIITENLEAAGAIGAEVFGNILSFRKRA